MPITLVPISRRGFLKTTLAFGAGLAIGREVSADVGATEVDRMFLLSDPHLNANATTVVSGVNMTDQFKFIREQVLAAMRSGPSALGVILNGDCAHKTGTGDDYKHIVDLLGPISAKLTTHLTLGNHDDRANLLAAFPAGGTGVVEDRHVTVIEAPRADWILLDSLEKTNSTPGLLGAKQLAWLAGELDRRPGKPAIVVVHHNPQLQPPATAPTTQPAKLIGMRDTRELYDVLAPRRRAKALIFGHLHDWASSTVEGIHQISLPPVGYVFQAGKPSGWVDAVVRAEGMSLKLNCVDPKHPKAGEEIELAWRA